MVSRGPVSNLVETEIQVPTGVPDRGVARGAERLEDTHRAVVSQTLNIVLSPSCRDVSAAWAVTRFAADPLGRYKAADRHLLCDTVRFRRGVASNTGRLVARGAPLRGEAGETRHGVGVFILFPPSMFGRVAPDAGLRADVRPLLKCKEGPLFLAGME